VTDFGFQPGIQEYWMLLSDWRNGSFAILLAPTVLFFAGYVLALPNKTLAAELLGPVEWTDRSALSSSTPGANRLLRALVIAMGSVTRHLRGFGRRRRRRR
jgi:hypothetical protein